MKRITVLMLALFSVALLKAQEETGGYQIGDVVQDFALVNVNGQAVSLSDYDDAEGFIVVFTCNTCPVAVAYEDRINALDAKFKDQGYPVIAINPNDPGTVPAESHEHMKVRAAEKGFTFPYLLDPDHVITKQFAASRTPHAFVLQKTTEGPVLQYIGAIDDDSRNADPDNFYVEDAIAALKKGEKPTPDFTKAVGCTIKWKKDTID